MYMYIYYIGSEFSNINTRRKIIYFSRKVPTYNMSVIRVRARRKTITAGF